MDSQLRPSNRGGSDVPAWVSNENKYTRALQALKEKQGPFTEQDVKELYVKYGGLVLAVPEVVEAPKVVVKKVVKETPVKKGRAKK